MLKILIVEDDRLLADTLKRLVELNPLYTVTAVVDHGEAAVAAVEERLPDIALIDLQLARGTTGFAVAAKLGEYGVPCLFMTGKAPSFPLPDLALGVLAKPFSEEDLVRTLKAAEDMLKGRQRLALRPSRPANLRIYADEGPDGPETEATIVPRTGGKTLKRRIESWWQHRQARRLEAAE
jgi:CheY-like chemotaxis protein